MDFILGDFQFGGVGYVTKFCASVLRRIFVVARKYNNITEWTVTLPICPVSLPAQKEGDYLRLIVAYETQQG